MEGETWIVFPLENTSSGCYSHCIQAKKKNKEKFRLNLPSGVESGDFYGSSLIVS